MKDKLTATKAKIEGIKANSDYKDSNGILELHAEIQGIKTAVSGGDGLIEIAAEFDVRP